MINLMVGSIFEDGYIEKVDSLNLDYSPRTGVRVNELYGSMRAGDSGIPTARPDFRMGEMSWGDLEDWVIKCHSYDLDFNYTMNSPTTGKHGDFKEGLDDFIDSLKRLEEMGVDRVTVANPLIMELVSKNTNFPIEVSTILHVNSLHHVKYYGDSYNGQIDTICPDLYRNRDISFMRNMNSACSSYGIRVQILATEFCIIEGVPCKGIYRTHCYDIHGQNMPKEEVLQFGNYPMGRCIFSRGGDKSVWLKSRVIYPNDLQEYADKTGIQNYKITCRTAPKDFGLFLVEKYLAKHYDGNLMGLWMQLQTITPTENRFHTVQTRSEGLADISCKELSEKRLGGKKFYDKWFDNPDFRCDENICAECGWCHEWAELV